MKNLIILISALLCAPLAWAGTDLSRYVTPEAQARLQADPAAEAGSSRFISQNYRFRTEIGEFVNLTIKAGRYTTTHFQSHTQYGNADSTSMGFYSGLIAATDSSVLQRAFYSATAGKPPRDFKYMTVTKFGETETKIAYFCKLEKSTKADAVIPGLPGDLHKYLCESKNSMPGLLIPTFYNYLSDYLNYTVHSAYKTDVQPVLEQSYELDFYTPDGQKRSVHYGDLRGIF